MMTAKEALIMLLIIAGIFTGVLVGLRVFVVPLRCVPGQNDPCRDVYGNKGSYNCKSNGYWPDYCRVNGKLVEM